MYNGNGSGFFAEPAKKIQQNVPVNPDLPAFIWDVEGPKEFQGPIGRDKAPVFQKVVFDHPAATALFLKYHSPDPKALYNEPGFKALTGKPDQAYFEYFLHSQAEEKLDDKEIQTRQLILEDLKKAWPAAFEEFLKTYKPYAEVPALLKHLSGQGYAMSYASGCNGAREVLRKGEVLQYMQGGIAPSAALQGQYQCIIEPKAPDQKEMEAKIDDGMRDKPEVDIFAQSANLVLHRQPGECVIVEDCERAAFNADKFLAFFLLTDKTKEKLEEEYAKEFQGKKLPGHVILIKSPAAIKGHLETLQKWLKEARAHQQAQAPAPAEAPAAPKV